MKKLIFILAAAFFLYGCIDNDLPYPVVVPHITALDVIDAESATIDYESQVVTVVFPETKDLRSVMITDVELDQQIAVPSIDIIGPHDLSSPLKFKIRTYE